MGCQIVLYLESCNPWIHRVTYPHDIGLPIWFSNRDNFKQIGHPNENVMSASALPNIMLKQKVPYLESCNPRIHRVPYPPDIGLSLWYTL